MITQTVGT